MIGWLAVCSTQDLCTQLQVRRGMVHQSYLLPSPAWQAVSCVELAPANSIAPTPSEATITAGRLQQRSTIAKATEQGLIVCNVNPAASSAHPFNINSTCSKPKSNRNINWIYWPVVLVQQCQKASRNTQARSPGAKHEHTHTSYNTNFVYTHRLCYCCANWGTLQQACAARVVLLQHRSGHIEWLLKQYSCRRGRALVS